jgi:2-oxoisovalerate dehydrogenase E1 component
MHNNPPHGMLNLTTLLDAYQMMVTARTLSDTVAVRKKDCQYMFATSRGHEAIQIATGLQLQSCDWLSACYRDDSLLLSMGFSPYELMLQLLGKKNDPFSGGRTYYAHPSSKEAGKPSILHQSSAAGMQAIPSTGLAHAIRIAEETGSMKLRKTKDGQLPIVVCSMGDVAPTEGELSEAMLLAAQQQLPIVYLVQDNLNHSIPRKEENNHHGSYDWSCIGKGLERLKCDGSNFAESFLTMMRATQIARIERKPVLVHATLSQQSYQSYELRKGSDRYQKKREEKAQLDPVVILRNVLLESGITEDDIRQIEQAVKKRVEHDFDRALHSEDPDPASVEEHVFADTPIREEMGTRTPVRGKEVGMEEAALSALEELMEAYPESVIYGLQSAGRLGGKLGSMDRFLEKFGQERVCDTGVDESYIIGSTAGMSALGMKPIVDIQCADFIYTGLNQLVNQLSKSCYLTNGKFPVQMLLRVPVGAYHGGGPYNSASIESTLLSIKGIKVVYPSNAADMKGLMKAAFMDPNPVVILEHKGLMGENSLKNLQVQATEPASDYIIPLGKARIVSEADAGLLERGMTLGVISYGMGVHWALEVAAKAPGMVEILDLRSLYPLDEEAVVELVKRHGKVLIVTEEPRNNSFTEALAHRITRTCYCYLDAPVEVVGALDLPAIPMHRNLEQAMIPGVAGLGRQVDQLLAF